MITKEIFVKCIREIEEYDKRIENINKVLYENCEDAIYYPPSLKGPLLELLKAAFDDKSELIDYYIFELDYGKRWTPESITINGKSVRLTNPEELYTELQNNKQESE